MPALAVSPDHLHDWLSRMSLKKSAALGGVAACLATTLVVTTPNTADALVPLLAVPAVAALGGGASVSGMTVAGAAAALGLIGLGAWVESTNPYDYELSEDQQPQTPWAWMKEMFSQTEDVSIPIDESQLPIGRDGFAPQPDPLPSTHYQNGKGETPPQLYRLLTKAQMHSSLAANVYFETTISGWPAKNENKSVFYTTDATCRNNTTGAISNLVKTGSLGTAIWTDSPEYTTNPVKASAPSVCYTGTTTQLVTIRPATYPEIVALAPATAQSTWVTLIGTKTVSLPDYQLQDPRYLVGVDCVNPATGTKTTIYESYPIGTGHVGVPSCYAAGLGTYAERIFTDFLEGGKPRQPMWEVKPKIPPRYDPEVGDTSWTECDPGFGPVCTMDVYVNGVKCEMLAPECLGWLERTQTNPGTVECRFGNRVVHISNCWGYEHLYQGSKIPAHELNADGKPGEGHKPPVPWETPVINPSINPNPGPQDTPDEGPSTDPDTHTPPTPSPDPLPEPPPAPNKEPDPPTDPSPEPTANPSGEPTAPPSTGPEPPGVPTTGTTPQAPGSLNCSNIQWSWNPVDWVYVPVKCAIEWAFMPKVDYKPRINAIGTNIANKPPLVWIPGNITGPAGGGCPNWTVHVAGMSKNIVCESSFTAAIVGARGPLFGLVASAMLWPLIRSLWYAALPVLRAVPSK